MKALNIAGTVLTLALSLVVLSPSARADEATQQTRLTFSAPIQIPGNKVLPAGTYWFSVPDPIGAPNSVAIYSANNKHLEAMVNTRPVWRSFIQAQASGDTQLTLAQQSSDGSTPDALVNWFYQGNPAGHEFLYSHRMDRQLSEEPQVEVQAGRHHSTAMPPPPVSGDLGGY